MSIPPSISRRPANPAEMTLPIVPAGVPTGALPIWATSERDLAAVAGVRARWSPMGRPLPPCGRAPRVCRALLAMSA